MDSRKEVGKRLKEIRSGLDLTQEQFSELLDISTQLYKKMESGENNISISTLKKMKQKLNFSTDYLLFGERDTFIEVWNRILSLHEVEKQRLLIRLFCEASMNHNEVELKEAAKKYDQFFEQIKESLVDQNEYGKEDSDIGR